jgi:acyl-CoA reductase-like NAD-dependent aldehyde dehydrogenase
MKRDKITSVNPSNGTVLGEISTTSNTKIIEKIKKARAASQTWQVLGISGRIPILQKLVDRFIERRQEFAELTDLVAQTPNHHSLSSLAQTNKHHT